MQAIEILDIKSFMQLLFQSPVLDRYEFVSGELRTDMSYSFDGHINRAFFTEDECDTLGLNQYACLPWHIAKEKLFALIKGKKTPAQLKIVLKVCSGQVNSLISSIHTSLHPNDVSGMFLNILFQDNSLTVVCGVSYQIFTMDKSLEDEFCSNIHALLKSNSITCK